MLGTLLKLKRGELDSDAIPEMLSAMGIDAKFETLQGDAAFVGFRNLAGAASLPSSQLVQIRLTMKSGQTVSGLLVLRHHTGQ